MDNAYIRIVVSLLAALCAGGIIGLERSRRGRQAGLREHMLVCLATCQLMLIGVFNWHEGVLVHHPYDPNSDRIIQGVMSGIGFLGAGGIIKEGFSVRGVTTAASIWMTAAIGVMIGIGFYFPAAMTTLLTMASLTLMRRWEEGLHRRLESSLHLRQFRADALHEPQILTLIAEHGFAASSLSAQGTGEGRFLDYKAVLTTLDKNASHRLIETLANDTRFIEFSLKPLE